MAIAIGAISISGLTPAPSPLAAQGIDIDYEGHSLLLTYRKGFGANVTLESSTDLVSWTPIQTENQVTEIDSGGETITSSLAIEALRQFFRLAIANASSATLAWDAPPDPSVSGYRLRYGFASKKYTKEIDVGYNTQATIFVPPSGAAYFLVVTAYNAVGLESPPSNELKVFIH